MHNLPTQCLVSPQDLTLLEAAALTASSHRTSLDLSYAAGWMPPVAYNGMFPDGRRLPHPRELTLGLVIANSRQLTARQLVQCCPGVTYLALKNETEFGLQVRPGEPSRRPHGVSQCHSQYCIGVACYAAAGLFPLAVGQLVLVLRQCPCLLVICAMLLCKMQRK
jgi:hypothetical protein